MKALIATITAATATVCLAFGDTPPPKLGDDLDKTRASISGIAEVEKLDAEHMKIKGFNAARNAVVEFIMENGVQVAQIWHDEFTDYELVAFLTQYGAPENWLFSATAVTPTYWNPTAAVFIIIGDDKTLTVCTHEAAKYLGLGMHRKQTANVKTLRRRAVFV